MSDDVAFEGRIRRWRDGATGGLAVVDIPHDLVAVVGGRRQMRLTGTIDGRSFTGSTMLATGGGFCIGVSQAAMRSVGVEVGTRVRIVLANASADRRTRS